MARSLEQIIAGINEALGLNAEKGLRITEGTTPEGEQYPLISSPTELKHGDLQANYAETIKDLLGEISKDTAYGDSTLGTSANAMSIVGDLGNRFWDLYRTESDPVTKQSFHAICQACVIQYSALVAQRTAHAVANEAPKFIGKMAESLKHMNTAASVVGGAVAALANAAKSAVTKRTSLKPTQKHAVLEDDTVEALRRLGALKTEELEDGWLGVGPGPCTIEEVKEGVLDEDQVQALDDAVDAINEAVETLQTALDGLKGKKNKQARETARFTESKTIDEQVEKIKEALKDLDISGLEEAVGGIKKDPTQRLSYTQNDEGVSFSAGAAR